MNKTKQTTLNHIEPHSTTSLSTWHKKYHIWQMLTCFSVKLSLPNQAWRSNSSSTMSCPRPRKLSRSFSIPVLSFKPEVWVEGTLSLPQKLNPWQESILKIKLATTIIFPSHSKSLGSFSDVYIVLPYWNVNLQVWRCRQDSLSIPLSPQSPGSQQPPFLAADPGTKSDLYRYCSH